MELTEHLSSKYGYEYISTVEEYITSFKYRDKLGPCWESDGVGFDYLERVIMGYGFEEKRCPFTRINSFVVARGSNRKVNLISCNYFEIELNDTRIISSDGIKVIIANADKCVYKRKIKGEEYIKDVIFSKGNDMIGYNFVTRSTFEKKDIGKCVRANKDELVVVHEGNLVTYKVLEEDEGIDYIDVTRIVRQNDFYEDDKEIVRCTPIDTEIKEADKFYHTIESMHDEVYQLDFKDKTSRLLIITGDSIKTTDYYGSLKYRKPYIYPPLDESEYAPDEYMWPDIGLTFNYSENGEKKELLLDEKLNVHHRPRILNLSDRG
jgi:hypothetical protein